MKVGFKGKGDFKIVDLGVDGESIGFMVKAWQCQELKGTGLRKQGLGLED